MALTVSKKEHFEIGDETTVVSNPVIDVSEMTFFDELEYDCWNLFKQYLGAFDIKIVSEDDDEDDIDFSIAKEIQERVLDIIKESGIKFRFD